MAGCDNCRSWAKGLCLTRKWLGKEGRALIKLLKKELDGKTFQKVFQVVSRFASKDGAEGLLLVSDLAKGTPGRVARNLETLFAKDLLGSSALTESEAIERYLKLANRLAGEIGATPATPKGLDVILNASGKPELIGNYYALEWAAQKKFAIQQLELGERDIDAVVELAKLKDGGHGVLYYELKGGAKIFKPKQSVNDMKLFAGNAWKNYRISVNTHDMTIVEDDARRFVSEMCSEFRIHHGNPDPSILAALKEIAGPNSTADALSKLDFIKGSLTAAEDAAVKKTQAMFMDPFYVKLPIK